MIPKAKSHYVTTGPLVTILQIKITIILITIGLLALIIEGIL